MLLKRMLARLHSPPQPRIIVCGMPKSGTTAVAMLLGAASGHEVNSDPFYRLDRAGVVFRDQLYGGSLSFRQLLAEHPRFFRGGLIKDPNFIYLPEAIDTFTGAGLVYVSRDPRDNIRSILNRLKLPGRLAAGQTFQGVSDAWLRVLNGRTPDVPGDNYIERLAHRWALAARNYHAARHRMTIIRYETFNSDKVAAVEAVLRTLGIAGGRPIGHLVDRQFQPRGQRETTPSQFFGADELLSIETICAAEMDRLGYSHG